MLMVNDLSRLIPRLFRQGLWCLLLLFPFNAVVAQERQALTLYTYHLMPPHLIDLEKEQGLYFDVARYLNSHNSRYQFNVKYLPRKRIKRLIENHKLKGAVLGVSPTWFKDKSETRYLWTASVLSDRDLLVSIAVKPFEYKGPSSLIGKTVGGVLGFYYFGVDELVAEGKVARLNTHSEEALLSMVLSQRVNAGIISEVTLAYLVKRNQWQGKFYVAKQPHDQYERRIMLLKDSQDAFAVLQQALQSMQSDPSWHQQVQQYQ